MYSYTTTFKVYHRTLELLRRTHFHSSFAPSSALHFHRLNVTLGTVQGGILSTKQTALRLSSFVSLEGNYTISSVTSSHPYLSCPYYRFNILFHS